MNYRLYFMICCFIALGLTAGADVVINEIHYNPEEDNDNGEFLELYNTSEEPFDISDWEFVEGISFRFPKGTVIEGEGFLVVCRNEFYIRDFYNLTGDVKTVGNFAPSRLANEGERLLLEDAEGNEIDRVEYLDVSPWPEQADGDGASLELMHPLSDNNQPLYWRDSDFPTPGKINTQHVGSVPPLFDRVHHRPTSPTTEDTVDITVRFKNADEIQAVLLTYRPVGEGAEQVTMERSGDEFLGTIPAHESGQVISYAITATNQAGLTLTVPVGTESRFLYQVDAPEVEPGAVVINEIMYNPPVPGEEEQEWIELYNPGDQPLDVSYWIVKDRDDDHELRLPPDTTIEANGFLLVTNDPSEEWEAPTIDGMNFRLGNGGDEVRVMNPNGELVAQVEYNDDSEWPWGADGDGGSLELLQVSRPNNEPNNWGVSPNGGTPGKPNARAIEDDSYHDFDVVINELNYHPENEEYDNNLEKEYIELHNRSDRPIDVGGWFFSEGIEFRIPEGTVIEGNGYLLICKNTERYPEVENKVGNYMLKLANGGESVALTNDQGIVIDYIDYDDEFPWPVLADGEGHSMELMNPYADNRGGQYWHAGDPASPGEMNSVWVENTPPRISRIKHTPERPTALANGDQNQTINAIDDRDTSVLSLTTSGDVQRVHPSQEETADQIKITARVRDEDDVDEVYLHYQRLTSPLGTGLVLGEWKKVPMVDDGTAGDERAGDQYYTAILNNAETIRPHEVWRYRISAKDALGNETMLPRQNELTRNFAFFVEDGMNQPEYPTVYLFMERSVLNWLNQNVQSNKEQPSIVVVDGKVYDLYHEGGVRYRGHVLRNKPKKSWKVRFAKGNRWNGRRAMNLNSNYQTSPLVRGESGFMEHLSYSMFDQIGFEAADTDHRRVVLNNEYYGLFLSIEQYNEDFLDHHDLPDETQIFKAGVDARRSYMAREPNFDTYASKYEFTMGQDEDIHDLIEFIEKLNTTNRLKDFFEENVNIEKYLDYLTLVAVLSHVDSTEKNYFPTKAADGRWFIMPWDMSHTWGEIHTNAEFPFIHDYSLLDGAAGGVFGTNKLRQKFLQVPEYRTRYYQRLREFVDHLFTREHLDPIFDSYWDYLKDAIEENKQRWNSPGQLDQMVDEMKKYVSARREFILDDNNVRGEDVPSTAENLFPAEDELVGTRDVTLRVSSLDSNPGNVGETQWEIQYRNRDFFQPLWSGGNEDQLVDEFKVPATVLATGETYYWRMRYRLGEGDWSDWSEATSFRMAEQIPPPDVDIVEVTPLDRSARIEWVLPVSTDLLRVDIFEEDTIIESTEISDNRVRIRDLINGQEYEFTIRIVDREGNMSPGITVHVTPAPPPEERPLIAYFRFEDNVRDENEVFIQGRLLGEARIEAPGAEDPVPQSQAPNTASLLLTGNNGDGFQFGSSESSLDREELLTLECYAMLDSEATQPQVLIDRYDEENADVDGVWRFGMGLHQPGSLDFFFNDIDTDSGINGRLHISAISAVPQDGEFHHYAVVVDLREPLISEKVRMYIDGWEVETTIVHDDGISDYDSFRTESDLPVMVGSTRLADRTTKVFSGRIDEVRLMGEVLAPSQFLHPPTGTEIEAWTLY